jgi:hypothetical protein
VLGYCFTAQAADDRSDCRAYDGTDRTGCKSARCCTRCNAARCGADPYADWMGTRGASNRVRIGSGLFDIPIVHIGLHFTVGYGARTLSLLRRGCHQRQAEFFVGRA